jgi:hypothetical protein
MLIRVAIRKPRIRQYAVQLKASYTSIFRPQALAYASRRRGECGPVVYACVQSVAIRCLASTLHTGV